MLSRLQDAERPGLHGDHGVGNRVGLRLWQHSPPDQSDHEREHHAGDNQAAPGDARARYADRHAA